MTIGCLQCFYVGGLDTSATGILPMISTPLSKHFPVEKICERLKKADNAICELRYSTLTSVSVVALDGCGDCLDD